MLNNYLIPFFENEEFLTKKGKDFYDFKIMCKVIYDGGHRIDQIKALILKLSNTMNNFRLSTYNGEVKSLTLKELEILSNAEPTVIRLLDGRVIDSTTQKILPKLVCCVYEILTEDGSFILANSLSEAANIVGLYPDTLSKYLDFNTRHFVQRSAPNPKVDHSALTLHCPWGQVPSVSARKGEYVAIKKHFIKRVRVFIGQAGK